jgi:hypothetical protein
MRCPVQHLAGPELRQGTAVIRQRWKKITKPGVTLHGRFATIEENTTATT